MKICFNFKALVVYLEKVSFKKATQLNLEGIETENFNLCFINLLICKYNIVFETKNNLIWFNFFIQWLEMEMMKVVGCRPPYWETQETIPNCTSNDQLKKLSRYTMYH